MRNRPKDLIHAAPLGAEEITTSHADAFIAALGDRAIEQTGGHGAIDLEVPPAATVTPAIASARGEDTEGARRPW